MNISWGQTRLLCEPTKFLPRGTNAQPNTDAADPRLRCSRCEVSCIAWRYAAWGNQPAAQRKRVRKRLIETQARRSGVQRDGGWEINLSRCNASQTETPHRDTRKRIPPWRERRLDKSSEPKRLRNPSKELQNLLSRLIASFAKSILARGKGTSYLVNCKPISKNGLPFFLSTQRTAKAPVKGLTQLIGRSAHPVANNAGTTFQLSFPTR